LAVYFGDFDNEGLGRACFVETQTERFPRKAFSSGEGGTAHAVTDEEIILRRMENIEE